MEYERKGVTITWQIENLKRVREQKMELYSPVISVDVMDGTKWRLGVYRINISNILLTIKREAEDNGPERFRVCYEFSVHGPNGSFSSQETIDEHQFQAGERSSEITVKYQQTEAPDAMMIRCRLLIEQNSISKSVHFFARTLLSTGSYIFNGKVENFSKFSGNEIKTLKTVVSSTGERLMTVNLYLFSIRIPNFDSIMGIEIIPISNQSEIFFNFRCFILDSSGYRTDVGKFEKQFRLGRKVSFVLRNASKEYILKNAKHYLTNDTLSLHCEFTFWSGVEYESVERIEYETDTAAEAKQTELSKAVELLTSSRGIPCDTKIQTSTETFLVHRYILIATSPVFETMFKTTMKEAAEELVHIDDVDSETLERMLVFMYSNTLDDLEWKDALKLYVAAYKYQMLTLKRKCSALLKRRIDLFNCIVLLLQADMHRDKALKSDVQCYIGKYSGRVLCCDQWRDLERNFPHLAIETLRDVYSVGLLM